MTKPTYDYTQADILAKIQRDTQVTKQQQDRAKELGQTGMCWAVSLAWLNLCAQSQGDPVAAGAQRHAYFNNPTQAVAVMDLYDYYQNAGKVYFTKNPSADKDADSRIKRRKSIVSMSIEAPDSGLNLRLAEASTRHREINLSKLAGNDQSAAVERAKISAGILLEEIRDYTKKQRGWLINVNAFDPADQQLAKPGQPKLRRHTVAAFREATGHYMLFDPNYGEWQYDNVNALEASLAVREWLSDGVLSAADNQAIRRISWVVIKKA